jgi:two-component system OmpR family sensor kinase
MRNISVATFIHTIFILALFIISVTLYIIIDSTKDQRKLQEFLRYKYITRTLLENRYSSKDAPALLQFEKKYSLSEVPMESVKKRVEDIGKTKLDANSILGRARVFELDDGFYIYLEQANFAVMLKDGQSLGYTTQLIISVAIILVILLVILYLMVLRKLLPLKRLNKKIEQFANGDLNVKITHEGSDEIGKIAMNFDKAIRYIRQLISSKNLFMRNIMHELKTPITTSRIAAETIEDETLRAILIRSFNRMNELIEDLAQVELVTMHTFIPQKENYKLSEIFEEVKKMLLKDKSFYKLEYSDETIYTDKSLLALVLKNLIDNGIKYSSDHVATVSVVGNKILVKSKGEPLKEDLSYYIEPFSQEEKRSSGFGLGLYIVATILEKLNYKFRYRYDSTEGENIFEVILD